MMNESYFLLYLLCSPLLGMALILFSYTKAESNQNNIKLIGIASSLLTFILSLFLYQDLATVNHTQFIKEMQFHWFSGYNISFHLGVDAISTLLIVLTSFLISIALIYSYCTVKEKVKAYYALFLGLEFLIIGSFVSLDLVLFYIFFESVLIPMFFIILIWGGKDSVYASYKFFLYTVAGSIFMLVAIIYIYTISGTTDIVMLTQSLPNTELGIQKFLWLAMFVSFAVKTPMWPFHNWLPYAHVQAPTAGSIILAGILLKMGGYGFIRFSLPMFPQASAYFQDFVFILSVLAIIYASFVAFAQDNMKKLVAYSSIAHMGYVTLGLFSGTEYGINGAVFQMISHGLVSSALFLSVGILADLTGSKHMGDYQGLAAKMPNFAIMVMIFTLGSIGLPGTSGFVGEFLSLIGTYQVNHFYGIVATVGVVLGSIYMLSLYRKVMFGTYLHNNITEHIKADISPIQIFLCGCFVLPIIILGIYPSIITDFMALNIKFIITQLKLYGF